MHAARTGRETGVAEAGPCSIPATFAAYVVSRPPPLRPWPVVVAVLSVPSERAAGGATRWPVVVLSPSLSQTLPAPPASGVARRPNDHKTHISPHNLSFYDGIKGLMGAINRIAP